jgi:cysteine desulfurase
MRHFIKRRIYLDYASASPVDPKSSRFANPSSLHLEGQKTRQVVTEARGILAESIGAKTDEVIFTSGGTESNNLAINGFFNSLISQGKKLDELHAVCTEIEHSSVLECFKRLASNGLAVSYLKVLPSGKIDIRDLNQILRPETVMASIMFVNNEIGIIQPVKEISKILNHHQKKQGTKKIVFHTDAVQAPLYINIDVEDLGIDLLSLDSGKIYGPKGIGLLYKRRNLILEPIIYGGAQEKGIRPGTLNVPGIIGFSAAMKLALARRDREATRLSDLRRRFLDAAKSNIEGLVLIGSLEDRIANNINIFIEGIESEYAVIKLDEMGFAVSSQSACLLETAGGYHVISALGQQNGKTGSSIRITMGKDTRYNHLSALLQALLQLITLRT